MIKVRWHPKDGEETILEIEEGADPFAVLATVEKRMGLLPGDGAGFRAWTQEEISGAQSKLVGQGQGGSHPSDARTTNNDNGRGDRGAGKSSSKKRGKDRQPIRAEAKGNKGRANKKSRSPYADLLGAG